MGEVSSRTEEVGEVQRLVELIEGWKKMPEMPSVGGAVGTRRFRETFCLSNRKSCNFPEVG